MSSLRAHQIWTFLMQDSRPIVWYMTVSNRDAVTARGITVGDSLKK